jgi:hypothetical protein
MRSKHLAVSVPRERNSFHGMTSCKSLLRTVPSLQELPENSHALGPDIVLNFPTEASIVWGEKIWKGVLVCEGCKERIRLYQHQGLNYSRLQNKTQVAAFSKNAVTIGSGDQYEIRVNDDANLMVVICIVLAIDLSENEGNNTSITYHFGNIGPEDRLFDKTWEPG